MGSETKIGTNMSLVATGEGARATGKRQSEGREGQKQKGRCGRSGESDKAATGGIRFLPKDAVELAKALVHQSHKEPNQIEFRMWDGISICSAIHYGL